VLAAQFFRLPLGVGAAGPRDAAWPAVEKTAPDGLPKSAAEQLAPIIAEAIKAIARKITCEAEPLLRSNVRPQPIPSAVNQTPRLESQWTQIPGCRVHCRASLSGEGLPFVLIHGLVISSTYMIPLGERLATSHPVYALDLPGFGRSVNGARVLSIPELAESVLQWMSAAGIDRAHLVANSMGCQVAVHIAVRRPERVSSLVLIGPTIDPAAHSILIQFLRLVHDAVHEPPRLWWLWFRDFFRAGVYRALKTTQLMFRDYIEEQLPRILAPTLIVRGGHDPTLPQVAAERMLRLLLRAESVAFDGKSHCVHYTQPDDVAEVIEKALKENPATNETNVP
jgi:pimeloyl-ACP methyl ester carboxylesterase